ncbi:MAG: sugar ABC transporter permease [Actinobacteria bacterium]|nr:sugar ABC transporter permease [Actinomycetota bacterium]
MFRRRNEITSTELQYRALSDQALIRAFVLPTIILLLFVNIFPLFWSLILSFSNFTAKFPLVWGKNPRFMGIEQYIRLLSDPEIWERFITTAKYVVLSVSGEMLLGFGIALLLQIKFRGREFITTLLVLPMTMSPVIVGLMWKLFYNPNWGMFNYLLGLGKIDWATDVKYNLFASVIADVWMWTPFVLLLALAGLGAIPQYLYEAAEVDRASWWHKFTKITLPMVWPLLLVALIFRTMEAFKVFDITMGISGRGATAPHLLSLQLYDTAFVTWKTGVGSALGYIVLIMIIAITNIFIKYLNRAKQ